MNGMSYFMKYVISDIDCNEIRSKNKDLLKKIKELEEDNENLNKEIKEFKYKLDGIMNSQDEIYKKYTELIIKITNCKC